MCWTAALQCFITTCSLELSYFIIKVYIESDIKFDSSSIVVKGVEYSTTDSRDKSLGEVKVNMTLAYKKVSSCKILSDVVHVNTFYLGYVTEIDGGPQLI